MAHQPVRNVGSLLDAIRDEALEVHTAPDTINVFMELIDTVGWLEASIPQLDETENRIIAITLRKAAHEHALKCRDRGLLHLHRTYQFFGAVRRAHEQYSRGPQFRTSTAKVRAAEREARKLKHAEAQRNFDLRCATCDIGHNGETQGYLGETKTCLKLPAGWAVVPGPQTTLKSGRLVQEFAFLCPACCGANL